MIRSGMTKEGLDEMGTPVERHRGALGRYGSPGRRTRVPHSDPVIFGGTNVVQRRAHRSERGIGDSWPRTVMSWCARPTERERSAFSSNLREPRADVPLRAWTLPIGTSPLTSVARSIGDARWDSRGVGRGRVGRRPAGETCAPGFPGFRVSSNAAVACLSLVPSGAFSSRSPGSPGARPPGGVVTTSGRRCWLAARRRRPFAKRGDLFDLQRR